MHNFELEVINEGIVIRHKDGHVQSYYRPDEPSTDLVEHSRYCEFCHEKTFADVVRDAKQAAHEAVLNAGWPRR
jgi:hypothetical protein